MSSGTASTRDSISFTISSGSFSAITVYIVTPKFGLYEGPLSQEERWTSVVTVCGKFRVRHKFFNKLKFDKVSRDAMSRHAHSRDDCRVGRSLDLILDAARLVNQTGRLEIRIRLSYLPTTLTRCEENQRSRGQAILTVSKVRESVIH